MNNKPTKAGVIGHPIKHSKSPLIHNYWIKKHGLNGAYEALDIPCEDLKSGVQDLINQGYAGFNVTIPHKESIAALCDTVDPLAKKCGAVNTVKIENGKLHGFNTDAFGFLTNISSQASEFDFTSGPAAVIGAGGASRAILCGLIEAQVPEIRIINRTRAKAERIVAELGADNITIIEWTQRDEALQGVNLLVNASSLGMEGQAPLELSLDLLPKNALVNDIVYTPLQTPLLKAASVRGNKTVTGIGMLLHQARPAFEKWFGILPGVDQDLQELVLR